ncbi:MAG: hypothetical protein B7Z15_11395 [Rhizobiales bacterium 32-66-8]|nr:MAG: hypothetical protein B7Z15_11395 [Rhizobiales bacterium 32-66-8]
MRVSSKGFHRPVLGLGLVALAGLLAGCQAPGPSWGTATVIQEDAWGAAETVVSVPAPTAGPRVFQCSGPWAPNTTEVNLVGDFGAQAITRAEVQGPDGTMQPGIVLLAGDPKLRVDVAWADAIGNVAPTRVAFTDESQWTVAGIGIGSSLADLERANGRGFRIMGFGGNNGGVVMDWQGGRLSSIPGPCRVGVQLAVSALASDAAQAKASGPKVFASSDPAIRALNPTVGLFWVRYKW